MITVITASIPSRAAMLAECMASIAEQTHRPDAHLVGIDYARHGSSATRNALARSAATEWVALLDDDDIALTHHLALLYQAGGEADIVYSTPVVEGRSWNPSGPFDPDRLRRESYIPATALIRTDLGRRLDWWRNSADTPNGWEDWDFYLRALDGGARFAFVPEVTWRYRFHGGNKTSRGEWGAQ